MGDQSKNILYGKKDLPKLRLQSISFSWPNGVEALVDCSFSVPSPGLWMIVGGNGSGKSTLFRLISGLIKAQSGEFYCELKSALMLQNPDHQLLLPSCSSDLLLSISEGLNHIQRNEQITKALKQVDLEGMAERPIHTLSGGQKQRLAIAGALASQAELLLLDEPTALLDPVSQSSILKIVNRISRKSNKKPITALWITHRLEELTYCDGAAIMQKGRIGQWFSGDELIKRLK
ncbi:ABC transporter ATP-binding protein [Prochlorococcus marinus]|uniref:ABC transporter ATP-binding protein n=1 Tax=Prochlorococcus marinus TaxID=1219 RepID=UPI0022B40026|nr:ABC transporter ATP-binding protein [Prochlorococcus marinus]